MSIKIGLKINPPYTNPCAITYPETCKPPGINFELLQTILQVLNLKYSLGPIVTGGNWLDENGTWQGAMGLIQRGEVNLSGTVLTITEERVKYVGFSMPVAYNTYGFLIKRPKPIDTTILPTYLLRPLRQEVIGLSCFGFLLITSLKLFFVACLQISRTAAPNVSQVKAKDADYNEGYCSLRLLILAWELPFFVVHSFYSGQLLSRMVEEKSQLPFNGVNELADLVYNSKYRLVVEEDEISEWTPPYFKTNVTKEELNRNPYLKLKFAQMWNQPAITKNSSEISYQISQNENYVFYSSYYRLQELAADNCDIIAFQDTYEQPTPMAFPIQKDSELLELFRIATSGRDGSPISDYMDLLYKRYRKPRFCEPFRIKSAKRKKMLMRVQWKHVKGLFMMLAIGFGLALVTCIFEVMHKKLTY